MSLTCTVGKGDLPLKIHWQLNGVDLNTGNGVVINRNGKRISVLSIENVQHEHIGNYTCIAENDAGISSHSAVLNVNGIKTCICHKMNFYFIRTVFGYFVFIFTYFNAVLPPQLAKVAPETHRVMPLSRRAHPRVWQRANFHFGHYNFAILHPIFVTHFFTIFSYTTNYAF